MNDVFFNAWKNWRFFVLTVLPQQSQHSIFPSKIRHTNCHVAVAESMGDIKSIPYHFPVFLSKNHAYSNFEILEQYCFGCRWKESKNLENKTTREYVFVSPVYVSSIWLGWFLILKFSTKGFEIFTSKFRTWAFWMFISFFSTQGFRCSFKNQKPSTQGFEIKISQFST